MPLPRRLHQDVRKLSSHQIKELQAILKKLLHHKEGIAERLPSRKGTRHYTYRQEYVKCGKEGCKCARGKGHGPYWYAYWKEQGKLKKRYLGKTRR